MTKVLRTKLNKTEIPPNVLTRKKWDSRSYFGRLVFGLEGYGAKDDQWGIYQLRKCKEGKISVREKFYGTPPSWSEALQTAQDKFAAAVAAYQILTAEQRLVYHKRAVGHHYSGYNLFIIEFMAS